MNYQNCEMTDKKCLVEVDEILKHLSKDELGKIPENIMKSISENKDKNYFWKYDESKKLNEQNINRKTVAMLSYINMEYLCNQEQKKYLEELHRYNEKMAEKKKSVKYDVNNIFKNSDKDNSNIDKTNKNKGKELIKINSVKKQKWYKKIWIFLKRY